MQVGASAMGSFMRLFMQASANRVGAVGMRRRRPGCGARRIQSQVEILLQIARHHQNAGDLARSAVAWVECGKKASLSVMPQEAREALNEALAIEEVAPGSLSPVERAGALALLGKLEHEAGDLQAADLHYSEAVSLTPTEDVAAMGRRLFERAHVLEAQGAIELAEELVAKALKATLMSDGGAVRSLQLELRRYGAWLSYRAGDIAQASAGSRRWSMRCPMTNH